MWWIHFYTVPTTIAILFLLVRYINYRWLTVTNLSFDEMMSILNLTVRSEMDLYDRTILRFKGHINNSNYVNFYNDMCNHIFARIPKSFYVSMQRYITQEAIAEIITQSVQEFLVTKIGAFEKEQK